MSDFTPTPTPSYSGKLRNHMLMVPECINECSGIRIFGKRIKSIAFSTDAAIIKNINADAIIAVYPFTPQPVITAAIASNEKRKMKNEKLSRNLRILLILNF